MICGHGGRLAVRVVVPPLPSGRVTTIGGMKTLGLATKLDIVVVLDLDCVTLTLEKGTTPPLLMTTGGTSILRGRVVSDVGNHPTYE